jgi:hypothetical protein
MNHLIAPSSIIEVADLDPLLSEKGDPHSSSMRAAARRDTPSVGSVD